MTSSMRLLLCYFFFIIITVSNIKQRQTLWIQKLCVVLPVPIINNHTSCMLLLKWTYTILWHTIQYNMCYLINCKWICTHLHSFHIWAYYISCHWVCLHAYWYSDIIWDTRVPHLWVYMHVNAYPNYNSLDRRISQLWEIWIWSVGTCIGPLWDDPSFHSLMYTGILVIGIWRCP